MVTKTQLLRVLIISLMLPTLMINRVESVELPIVNQGSFDDLHYIVKALEHIRIGEDFSVVFEIYGTLDLYLSLVQLELYGAPIGWGENGWKDSAENITILEGSTYTKTANLEATEEGQIFGIITIFFYRISFPADHCTGRCDFRVTEVITKTYEELGDEYDSLNQSYVILENDYDSLKTQMDNTTTLIYIFIITTVIFVTTTGYLAIRKLKVKGKA